MQPERPLKDPAICQLPPSADDYIVELIGRIERGELPEIENIGGAPGAGAAELRRLFAATYFRDHPVGATMHDLFPLLQKRYAGPWRSLAEPGADEKSGKNSASEPEGWHDRGLDKRRTPELSVQAVQDCLDHLCRQRRIRVNEEETSRAQGVLVYCIVSPPRVESGNPPTKKRKPRAILSREAEQFVKRLPDGKFPGVQALARVLGCSTSSLTNAIKFSAYLKARKAEYNAARKDELREQRLTESHLDKQRQSTEPDPALALLIAEQEADRRRDARKAKPSGASRSR